MPWPKMLAVKKRTRFAEYQRFASPLRQADSRAGGLELEIGRLS